MFAERTTAARLVGQVALLPAVVRGLWRYRKAQLLLWATILPGSMEVGYQAVAAAVSP